MLPAFCACGESFQKWTVLNVLIKCGFIHIVIGLFSSDASFPLVSIDDSQKTRPAEINSYKQLWKDDSSAQSNNTPQTILAAGVSKSRTLVLQ